jgi:predicted TPR repeat methyltransferase
LDLIALNFTAFSDSHSYNLLIRIMPQTTPNDRTERPFLTRAYNLSSVDDARALYNEWATTYDKDLADPSHDWVAPALAVAALLDFFNNAEQDGSGETLEILDAGCGTGIVGAILAKQSAAKNLKLKIDGVDLSTGMLDVARKTGVYRCLETADMSKPLSIKDQSYHGVICVGVLTQGHVGPGVLPEFARSVKPSGCVVATVREDIWETGGYKREIDGLEREGKVQMVSANSEDSLRGASIKMRLLVLKRL